MKKFLSFSLSMAMMVVAYGQSDKYVNAMASKMPLVDSNFSTEGWQDLGNSYERIADAEKTQWLPYYYAAYCNIMAGYASMPKGSMGDNSATSDPYADKAETLLNKAEMLSKDNAEIYVVRKMVHGLRMMGNPMSRYMTESPLANQALEKAKSLNPNIPRIYILEGEDKFYTPEQFGGSKEEAKVLFEKAQALFASFQPESKIAPDWGRGTVAYFMGQLK